ncbi:tRNA uridine-5-carboxymethylaminomethyl(34) synthesis GTPase MnmE [Geothermobacter hydrogeniphilus]|uniref:tRNA modification GTPase MnmE n=1 Tax=Geothermobacter hydrogeniphilus TaxID=1969733 RepID=A0A1X0XZH5_9BACT|nr:tRNA uridine-5-carboxymethylaminomethyl(34) synthesis GTPase MnmE [Geothermobacter hydrogeniphilus]
MSYSAAVADQDARYYRTDPGTRPSEENGCRVKGLIVNTEKTIIAPATPPGEGGLAVVRLSGPSSEELLRRFFKPSGKFPSLDSHRLYHGHLVDANGSLIDEVMAVIMRSPRTFTREDVAEIHCHGGPLIVQQILDLFIDAGAILAQPGEFTLRAFLNGRIDLAQAEAVADLIHARSVSAQRVALNQLQGKLSQIIRIYHRQVVDLLALVEAHIDFLEEDISPPQPDVLCRSAEDIIEAIEDLIAGFNSGRMIHDGLRILLAGKPNVGKSSLLNCLLGESRAIVSPSAGTTRDIIEESLLLHDLPVRLIDTAGIRHTDDSVEQEGVRRAREKAGSADLVLLLINADQHPDQDDLLALDSCRDQKLLLVINKQDLSPSVQLSSPWSDYPRVFISAKYRQNIDGLIEAVRDLAGLSGGADSSESVMLYERRHYQSLLQAKSCLQRFISGCRAGFGFELLALDLRDTLRAIGLITGETTPDQVLDRIFSRFCIGK